MRRPFWKLVGFIRSNRRVSMRPSVSPVSASVGTPTGWLRSFWVRQFVGFQDL
jgi:hypothetical protein